MTLSKKIILSLSAVLMTAVSFAQPRIETTLEKGWKFTREDSPEFVKQDFDDSVWQNVRIPHDWAIYGPFSPDNDRQFTAIVQDGQTVKDRHEGRTGGLPIVGAGWYRLDFEIPVDFDGRQAELVFDGAMSNPEIYVNGELAGRWAYGYNSFSVNITPFINEGSNTLAVRLNNLPSASRWYPGAGLFRNVHLVLTDEAHVPVWGTQLTTPVVNKDFAKVRLETSFVHPKKQKMESYSITTVLYAADGRKVAESRTDGSGFDNGRFIQDFVVKEPLLWSPETPNLYRAVSEIYEGTRLCDTYETVFGIRSIELRPHECFFLNGKPVKFQGVCNHHDLGPLGAAVNVSALRYRLQLLKDMGCNAIRTSHNMPSPELVRLCDEMGFMVMAESFDSWKEPKVENGYNLLWDEWREKDLVNLVRHYRNNPSVVMWCVGNEVPEQHSPKGTGSKMLYELQSICHREDPTRPVTLGMDAPEAVVNNGMAAIIDVPGFNYRPWRYSNHYRDLPQGIVLGSETASTLSARGVYKFPLERSWWKQYDDHQCSSYDIECCRWSEMPEDLFIWADHKPWYIGEFVWTGFDYLGEPTPYYDHWPSHSSHFGIIDLASIPKDRFWLYRSQWNRTEETLHILPHWNWEGREGEVTPVFVYTNYPSAELFINGKSQGRLHKDMSIDVENSAGHEKEKVLTRQRRYRLMWMDTVYEPGTLKVVAYDEAGNAVASKEVVTAGKPYRIVLTPSRTELTPDGKDVAYVNVKVVDRDGNPCPTDNRMLKFSVSGTGAEYRAAANGNAADTHIFHEPQMPLFNGQLTVLVQSTETTGTATLKVSGKGLKSASVTFETINPGEGVLVEAESFAEKGGWSVDQQFTFEMGSPYLIAHGWGKPVEDAATTVKLPSKGRYHVYVRTYNWTSPWSEKDGAGSFQMSLDGERLENTLGDKGNCWNWQYAGSATAERTEVELRLHDLTGFDGRCDAVYITKSETDIPPCDVKELEAFREKCNPKAVREENYDFVVVGGGVAGMCAAASASRLGCKVALINDRPIWGGCNSSDVRVHLGGHIEMKPYTNLGNMIKEFGPLKGGNAQPAERYEDEKKASFLEGEENLTLFPSYRVYKVDMDGSKVKAVYASHIESGEIVKFTAPIFSDCTGDATVGYLAGADYSMGRESRADYNEPSAPEQGDKMTMGASVQWYSTQSEDDITFPVFEYGVNFSEESVQKVKMGEWTWETGMNRDQCFEAERIRDYGLMVVYSNWSYLKNRYSKKEDYRNRDLSWVAYVAGKRESRRLLGDHVLTENDLKSETMYDDATFTSSWSIDLHYPDPENSRFFPGNEFKSIDIQGAVNPYTVPYRCLYSRNIDNLFMAGRNISVTHIALGPVRVMRTTGMMGEVVGMAASICKEHDALPRDVYTTYLKDLKSLMTEGAGKQDLQNNQRYNLGGTWDKKSKKYTK